MKIICVIPAYNEENNIIDVINNVKPFVNEIVVVDDCSSDNTFLLAQQQNIIALKHIVNRGQGAALKTGTKCAIRENADIIIHFDADGQFFASDIEVIIKPLINDQADIVFGSRFINKEGSAKMPVIKKHFLMPLARFVNKLFFNINLTDPQSGFRAMTKASAEKMDWQQDRMAHCSEILHQSIKYNLRIKEVPIRVIYNKFGQQFTDGLRILVDLFLAKFIN